MIIFSLSVLTLIAILWFLGWYAKRWVVTDADYLLADFSAYAGKHFITVSM